MKVLHVFKDYFPPTRGGIEMHIHDIVHSMEGFEFEVLTSSRSRRGIEDRDGDVLVTRAPEYARPTSTPVTPSWRKRLRNTDADVIHLHMPNPFGELMLLASRTPVPVVVSYHADIVGRRAILPAYLPFQERVVAAARSVIVGSPPMLQATPLARNLEKAVVIPYGVDPDLWSARPPRAAELRDRFGPRIVMFLGRLAYYKGVDVLLEAMRDVDAKLVVAGVGPKNAELVERAHSLGVQGRTFFVGEITDEDRAAYYHAADVFALPATMRGEAFGIAMLQAMACGTPAVSTELGTGTSWVNLDGRTGFVVQPGDARALAAALRGVLDDPRRAHEMGLAAQRRVAERFTKSAMIEAIAGLYRVVGT